MLPSASLCMQFCHFQNYLLLSFFSDIMWKKSLRHFCWKGNRRNTEVRTHLCLLLQVKSGVVCYLKLTFNIFKYIQIKCAAWLCVVDFVKTELCMLVHHDDKGLAIHGTIEANDKWSVEYRTSLIRLGKKIRLYLNYAWSSNWSF